MKIYNSDLDDIGNTISQLILNEFEKPSINEKLLKKFRNAKPGPNEWTVMSGIVAIIDRMPFEKGQQTELEEDLDERSHKRRKLEAPSDLNTKEIVPLCLTTGVKTIPDVRFSQGTKGRLLHDLHAEVLSIRLFNFVLLKEVAKLEASEDDYQSKLIEIDPSVTGEKIYRLKKGITFGMYISDPPCGDCSLGLLKESFGDTAESWSLSDDKEQDGGLRGREHFNKVGLVRTKPGRKDSPYSSCKSCSDKLALRQFKSLLNSVTSKLFKPDSFHLKYLVLHESKIKEDDIQRCFYDRLVDKMGKERKFKSFNPLTVIPTTNRFPYEKSIDSKKTCEYSILFSPYLRELEICNKGVKNGCNSNTKPYIRPQDQCSISRESMIEQYKILRSNDDEKILTYEDYHEFKKSQIGRFDEIDYVKNQIFCGWSKGIYDNFTI